MPKKRIAFHNLKVLEIEVDENYVPIITKFVGQDPAGCIGDKGTSVTFARNAWVEHANVMNLPLPTQDGKTKHA